MTKPVLTLEDAFGRLTEKRDESQKLAERLRKRMREPGRAYHTEQHVIAVLSCLFEWCADAPSASLLAAALYHDAVYDATSKTNEADSADFCDEELAPYWGGALLPGSTRVRDLILATIRHEPHMGDREETLLCDADLYILGASPETYTGYVQAVRQEYAHVSADDWKVGRARVLRHFLERPRIYHSEGNIFAQREQAARHNLAEELAALER